MSFNPAKLNRIIKGLDVKLSLLVTQLPRFHRNRMFGEKSFVTSICKSAQVVGSHFSSFIKEIEKLFFCGYVLFIHSE